MKQEVKNNKVITMKRRERERERESERERERERERKRESDSSGCRYIASFGALSLDLYSPRSLCMRAREEEPRLARG